MTSIADFLSLATMLVVLGLIAASVMKLFQMAGDLHELKEILKDMRRMSQGLGNPLTAPFPVPVATPGVVALNAALPSGVPPGPGGIPPAPVYPQAAVPPAPVLQNTVPPAPGPLNPFSGTPPTPEELVRAVHAQDFSSDDFPL